MDNSNLTNRCFYCDMPIMGKIELDHFPIAQRHGGYETVMSCENCHNLKDRIPLEDFPPEIVIDFAVLWKKLTPIQRILFSKIINIVNEVKNIKNIKNGQA